MWAPDQMLIFVSQMEPPVDGPDTTWSALELQLARHLAQQTRLLSTYCICDTGDTDRMTTCNAIETETHPPGAVLIKTAD
jgi:hypothetical protein